MFIITKRKKINSCLTKPDKKENNKLVKINKEQLCDGVIDCFYKDDECNYECLQELKLNNSLSFQKQLTMCFGKSLNFTCESFVDGSLIPNFFVDFMCDGLPFCYDNLDED